MKGLRLLIIGLIAAAVGLFVSNPEMDDFAEFAEDMAGEIITREIGGGALGDALSSLGSSLTANYIDRVTERSNLFLWSTYTVGDPESPEGAYEFLGIAGRFIQMDSPDLQASEE